MQFECNSRFCDDFKEHLHLETSTGRAAAEKAVTPPPTTRRRDAVCYFLIGGNLSNYVVCS
jgi:hypothetical protein